MEDPHGCVTIHFHIDYIRKLLREEGSMVLKGEFKDGKLLEGSYKGPFWGFSSLMDKNAVYTGTFKDNVIEGMGVLHYNLGGGIYGTGPYGVYLPWAYGIREKAG